ncbi:GNAT family N-acetyltransferase [Lapillicoccus sp.]|uniref:GNAT family N-acetyltransferase n=1 Tax=Lapillicoccus sp. TaxID=1909287 RepID=UPI0039832924
MSLAWSRQERPLWDVDKRRVIGSAPAGALDVSYADDADLPGDWFVTTDDDRVVGFGWLDSTWGGDTEILLAVASDAQGSGVGSFVLENLEREAASRGTNYVYNTVRDSHPDREAVHDWLLVRGYRGDERDLALRKRVGVREAVPTHLAASSGGGLPEDTLPPGAEESGGYVDVEDHRY